MLQIKTFPVAKSDEASEFLKNHPAVNEGLGVLDGYIIIKYLEGDIYGPTERKQDLIVMLGQAKQSLLQASIDFEIVTSLAPNDKQTVETLNVKNKSEAALAMLKRKIDIIQREIDAKP